MASIREKRPGVWEVRVFIGTDARGRPLQRSKTFHGSRRDAEKWADDMAYRTPKSGQRTVADMLDEWFKMGKVYNWKYKTVEKYTRAIRQIKEHDPELANLRLANFNVEAVEQWQIRMADRGTGKSAMASRFQVLKTASQFAYGREWLSRNPCSFVRQAGRSKRRKYMPDQVVAAAFCVAEQVHDLAPLAFRIAAVTGARRAEVAAIMWDQIDDHGLLTIDRQVEVQRSDKHRGKPQKVIIPTKQDDVRYIPLDDVTLKMLHELREERIHGPLGLQAYVFSPLPEPPNPDKLTHWWRRARVLADIDSYWRLHDLRHVTGSVALTDHNLAEVAERLGHSDPSTTARVYSHARSGAAEEVTRTVADYVDHVTQQR